MPIEIKELHIKAGVSDPRGESLASVVTCLRLLLKWAVEDHPGREHEVLSAGLSGFLAGQNIHSSPARACKCQCETVLVALVEQVVRLDPACAGSLRRAIGGTSSAALRHSLLSAIERAAPSS